MVKNKKELEKRKRKKGKHEEAYTVYKIIPKWFQTFTNNSAIISNVKTLLTNSYYRICHSASTYLYKKLRKENNGKQNGKTFFFHRNL